MSGLSILRHPLAVLAAALVVLPFFTAGRATGSFDLGIQKALERLLVSAHFLFRIERPAMAVLFRSVSTR